MKKSAVVTLLSFALCRIGVAANTSLTLDSLSVAVEQSAPTSDLSQVFDGAGANNKTQQALPTAAPASSGIYRHELSQAILPKPVLVPVPDVQALKTPAKINFEEPLHPLEQKRVITGIGLLKVTKIGQPLADFALDQQSQLTIKVLWTREGNFDGVNYAEIKPPVPPKWEKKILLKLEVRDILFDSKDKDSLALAFTLAHELVHLRDFLAQGENVINVADNDAVKLMAELNAFTTEVLLYHQLRKAGKTPKPNTDAETGMVQWRRLYADIDSYVNGMTSKPAARNYRLVTEELGGQISFDNFIVTNVSRKRTGIWTFLEIVKKLYGMDKISADPPDSKKKLQQYLSIKDSLKATYKAYIRWAQTHGVYPEPDDDDSGSSAGPGESPPPFVPDPHFHSGE